MTEALTTKRRALLYALLAALLLMLAIINLTVGSAKVPVREIAHIIAAHDVASVEGTIVWNIRIPRIIAAIFLGGALALAGYLLQAFFANPIAGPYVLGISSGSKLVVAALMVASCRFGFMTRAYMVEAAAFIGALAATGLVILAARKARSMAILIVCGVMIGYVCSAATEMIVAFADDSNIVNLHNWSMGSFSAISWSDVRSFVPVVIVGGVYAFFLAKGVGAYLYGEQYAQSVGVNLRLFRVMLVVGSSVLSATVTAFAGPISFVGIAAPHVARSVFRTSDPKTIMAASFLGGASFCLLCDLLARSLFAPKELSVSAITAILGAPVVVSMLLRRKRGTND